ncbi:MAG: ArsC/Spx/MgsR family protein [Gammaproteobacteria bacterium]
MAIVHFYEKPGCFNNRLQKQLLLEAGHILFVHNILEEPWTREKSKLRSFFGGLPVAHWFNRSAPAIKNGDVIPETLNEHQAIELMTADPLLIRRPLLEVDGRRRAGFDAEQIKAWLEADAPAETDPETCPKHDDAQACRS